MLKDHFRHLLGSNKLKITMTELAHVTGVSTSQIRYWERKGYITSTQDEKNKNHQFNLPTIFQVATIKYFLDQGFTLTMAVTKEHQRRELSKIFRRFIIDRIEDVKQVDDQVGEVSLGKLADDPTKEVYAQVSKDGTTIHIRPYHHDHPDEP